MADRLFYETPVNLQGDHLDFAVSDKPLPPGWRRLENDDWLVHHPPGVALPAQGWKVHVSACLDNADRVLGAVWDYCVQRQTAFKFLRGRHLLLNYNSKYAHRGSSGKLVTIYPLDERDLELVLGELGDLLAGEPGPYILSDLRWAEGPLYVRYGGFADRYVVSAAGASVPAIEDGAGRLVPDRREPRFTVPPWVELPAFLAPHLAARTATSVEDLPYRVERPLHFSNGGGLYEAVDTRTGEKVVLKEARPYAGLSHDGRDAVARLEHERLVLGDLAGLEVVPRLRDHFVLGDHHFLVQGFVDGAALRPSIVDRYPLLDMEPDAARLAEYADWALRTCAAVEAAAAAVHERGVVIGDLHPYNILVRPDGRVTLIDFEVAARRGEECTAVMGDPAFAAPARVSGVDRDRYALACLRLSFFLPLTELFRLDTAKAGRLAGVIAHTFPVPAGYLAEAVAVITELAGEPAASAAPAASTGAPGVLAGTAAGTGAAALTADRDDWSTAIASLARGIQASATPERADRLFPGDIEQFMGGALGLAYGAAGVLYALAVTDQEVDPAHTDWLARRAVNPAPGGGLGLYDGLHGAAYTLDLLGRADAALDVLDIALREKWDRLGSDLSGGLAGVGLNLAHLADRTGEATLRDEALRALDIVADRLGDVDAVPTVSGEGNPHAGLLRGSAGPALLFLSWYQRTGESRLLDLAATALRQDLRRCVRQTEGGLEVNQGWRTLPYLGDGSVGIGLVLRDYLNHRHDDDFADAVQQITTAARSQFYIQSGLCYGRAGMILYLSRGLAAEPAEAGAERAVADQVRRLSWHALEHRGHLAFPGEQLLRLSMDLATGSAGVMLALGAALAPDRVFLPFLAPALTPAMSGSPTM